MTAASSVTLVTDAVVFAESPRWRGDRLWFSDVHDYKLKTVDLSGHVEIVADVPGRPAGLGFWPDGRVLLASALDRCLWWVAGDGRMELAADLSGTATGFLNDMVVDGDRGRAYVGDSGFRPMDGESFAPGRTLLFRDGEPTIVAAEDLLFPNGCAITPDGTTLYLAESEGQRVSRFDVGPKGELSGRTVFAELGDAPDGLCLDQDGCLWVGMIARGEFVRIAADGGAVVERVAAAANFAVTCVLGGDRRRTLLMCSAETTFPQLAQGISRGRIDAVSAPAAGAGWP